MVTLDIGPVKSRILDPDEEIDPIQLLGIRHALSYKDPQAFAKRKWGNPQAAAFIPDRKFLITEKKMEFRTGLLSRLIDQLELQDVKFTINDHRFKGHPEHPMMLMESVGFRDYQLEAITAGVEQMNGLIQMATGLGKTRVMAGIVMALERKAVLLVHRRDLMYQILEVLRSSMQWPQFVGQVGGGVYEPNIITVCTIQTISAALGINTKDLFSDDDERESVIGAAAHKDEIERMLTEAQVCVVDEAHHTPAYTISEVLARTVNAAWKIGMTATGWRDDGADLLIEAAIGPRIYTMSVSQGVDLGWLVPATIEMNRMAYEGSGSNSDAWNAIQSHFYTNNEPFHRQVLLQNADWYDAGKHILTLVTAVKHGDILKRMHRDFGIPTEYLSGRDPQSIRERVLNDFRNGHLKHLIGTSIADEGLDLPIIDAINLAGGGKSTTRTYQRNGRGVRTFPDKTHCEIRDYRCYENDKLKRHAGRRAGVHSGEKAWTFKEIK